MGRQEYRHGPRTPSGLAAVIERRFVHRENGKVITIYLACGRPGPLCIHTPDTCYPADGFVEIEAPRRKSVPGEGKTPSEFWTCPLHADTPGWANESAHFLVVAHRPGLEGSGQPTYRVRRRIGAAQAVRDPRHGQSERPGRGGGLRRIHARTASRFGAEVVCEVAVPLTDYLNPSGRPSTEVCKDANQPGCH